MANKTIDKNAVCPFYLADLKTGVRCEALTEGGTMILAFGDSARKEWHEKFYCCDICGHKACPVFRALMVIKYGEQV